MAFAHAQNTTIYGGSFTNIQGDNYNIGTTSITKPDSGLHYLFNVTSPGASFDSQERYPPPKCYPGTRVEIREDITEWIDSTQSGDKMRVLWLHGPAGAGKTAIAQTIAEDCHQRKILAASFFFSRGRSGCHSIDRLFTTIAYQLAINIAESLPYIERILSSDLFIIHKTVARQLQKLIIEPLEAVATSMKEKPLPSDPTPFLVVIDGLDECDERENQRQILEHVLSIASNPRVPLRFLIVSRPEYNILNAFKKSDLSKFSSQPISLYGHFSSREDVRKYLIHEFDRIYSSDTHEPWMTAVPKPWPQTQTLNLVVNRSDGYFIYASTLVRFVDQEPFSPIERLDMILESSSTSPGAFGELDKLYHQVLSTHANVLVLKNVLKAVLANIPTDIIAGLVTPPQVSITLRGLQSVIQTGSDGILHPIHASFFDFLFDPNRAGKFHIDHHSNLVDVTRLMLDCLRRCSLASTGGVPTISSTNMFLWKAAKYIYQKWFDRFKELGPHQDAIAEEILAMDCSCWFPMPADIHNFPWNAKTFCDMKDACVTSIHMLLRTPQTMKDLSSSAHHLKFIEYFAALLDNALSRVLGPLYPHDQWIVYGSTARMNSSPQIVYFDTMLHDSFILEYSHLPLLDTHELFHQFWKTVTSQYGGVIYMLLRTYLMNSGAVSKLAFDFKVTNAHIARHLLNSLRTKEEQPSAMSQGTRFAKDYWVEHLYYAVPGDRELLRELGSINKERFFYGSEEFFGYANEVVKSWEQGPRRTKAMQLPDALFRKQGREVLIHAIAFNECFRCNETRLHNTLVWLMHHPDPRPTDLIKKWKVYYIELYTGVGGCAKKADVEQNDDAFIYEWFWRIRGTYPRSLTYLQNDELEGHHRRMITGPRSVFMEGWC